MKSILWVCLFQVGLAGHLLAQVDADAEGPTDERVKYSLILPEEKNPETVKPEENNPFESATNTAEKDGNTEENRVRDQLLSMPVTGSSSGPDGIRVMLGSIRLATGDIVPPVLPDQQVRLRVKSISPTAIELVWMEKKPTGLPPKVLTINVDLSPRVRYQLPSNNGDSKMGSLKRDDATAFRQQDAKPNDSLLSRQEARPASPSATEPAFPMVARAVEVPEKEATEASPVAEAPPVTTPQVEPENPAKEVAAISQVPPPPRAEPVEQRASSESSASSSSKAPSASVLRMLFGNKPPPTAK